MAAIELPGAACDGGEVPAPTVATAVSRVRSLHRVRAQRALDVTAASIVSRGIAGTTFARIAEDANVSRGLLHYYFDTKERLLVEVVRRDGGRRLTRLRARLEEASDVDALLALLRVYLEDLVATAPHLVAVNLELFASARHNPVVSREFLSLTHELRDHVANVLAAKDAGGELQLEVAPGAAADFLFGLGDGLAIRMLGDPDRDWGPALDAAVLAARALLCDRRA